MATLPPETHCLGLGNIENHALLLTYRFSRLADTLLLFPELVISNEIAVRDGRKCIVLVSKSGDEKKTLWVDPFLDYGIVKYVDTRGDFEFQVLDVKWVADEKTGWVPDEWVMSMFNPDGSLNETSHAKIEERGINLSLPVEEFDIVFPPGTWISDFRDPNKPLTDYLVLPNGNKQIVNKADLPLPYQEVVKKMVNGNNDRQYLLWLLTALLLATVVSFALILHRRRRVSK